MHSILPRPRPPPIPNRSHSWPKQLCLPRQLESLTHLRCLTRRDSKHQYRQPPTATTHSNLTPTTVYHQGPPCRHTVAALFCTTIAAELNCNSTCSSSPPNMNQQFGSLGSGYYTGPYPNTQEPNTTAGLNDNIFGGELFYEPIDIDWSQSFSNASTPHNTMQQLSNASSPLNTAQQFSNASSPLNTAQQLSNASSPLHTAQQFRNASSPLNAVQYGLEYQQLLQQAQSMPTADNWALAHYQYPITQQFLLGQMPSYQQSFGFVDSGSHESHDGYRNLAPKPDTPASQVEVTQQTPSAPQTLTGPKPRKFVCPDCFTEFKPHSGRSSLSRHRRWGTARCNNNKMTVRCSCAPGCNKVYQRCDALTNHVRKDHGHELKKAHTV